MSQLTNQQLAAQNQLLQDQLNLLRQEEDVFSSISGMISGNLADLGRTNDVRNDTLSSARSLRSISDKLLANDKETAKLSEKELKKLHEQSQVALDNLKTKKDQLTLTTDRKSVV